MVTLSLIFLVTHEWSKSIFVLEEGTDPMLVPPPVRPGAFQTLEGALEQTEKDFKIYVCFAF